MKAKRYWITGLCVLVIFASTYFSAWYDIYSQTKAYYQSAEANYADGKKVLALKGGLDFVTGEFTGGYQHVVEAWDSKMVFPVPKIYQSAKSKVDTILNNLTPGEIDAMTKKYIKTDKKYIDYAMMRKADLLLEGGETQAAIDLYNEIMEIFPLNITLTKQISEKLEGMK